MHGHKKQKSEWDKKKKFENKNKEWNFEETEKPDKKKKKKFYVRDDEEDDLK
jgi:hypothetical protein